jgi:hypothetical protein|tara:strand:- start:574 stop:861 length:288 start_codon:yes stop_codon:yes gene_type:complete
MGKITRKDATDLIDKGIITEKDLKEMEDQNLVSKRGKTTKRYMKSDDGKWVEPMFYYKGLKKDGKYSTKMTKLRTVVNQVISDHTTTKEDKGVSK